MHSAYQFLTGPMVWISLIVFFGGSIYQLIRLILLVNRKEKFIYTYMSWKYSMRSILHWVTPFATKNWRLHPVLTVATFLFHICLILVPIFLLSHIILWDESWWNVTWWAIPENLADFMTIIVIAGCIFFLVRRLISPEVRYVTSASDYILLAIVAAPFITGFIATHQMFAYKPFFMAHIVTGEIFLIVIPFTRLIHMFFSPLMRAYMGSEFGGIRHARDY
ncbi:MAG: nitrate reductase [Nitrospira bacterium SG8_3]|nr:MAG: nitrate reductase [Nitrospira bacterium SG8_3]